MNTLAPLDDDWRFLLAQPLAEAHSVAVGKDRLVQVGDPLAESPHAFANFGHDVFFGPVGSVGLHSCLSLLKVDPIHGREGPNPKSGSPKGRKRKPTIPAQKVGPIESELEACWDCGPAIDGRRLTDAVPRPAAEHFGADRRRGRQIPRAIRTRRPFRHLRHLSGGLALLGVAVDFADPRFDSPAGTRRDALGAVRNLGDAGESRRDAAVSRSSLPPGSSADSSA